MSGWDRIEGVYSPSVALQLWTAEVAERLHRFRRFKSMECWLWRSFRVRRGQA